MKILVCSGAAAGGIGRHTFGVTDQLASIDEYTVKVAVPSTNIYLERYAKTGVDTVSVPVKFGPMRIDTGDNIVGLFLAYLYIIIREVVLSRPDVIYCTSWFPCGVISSIVNYLLDSQVVIIAHGDEVTFKNVDLTQRLVMLPLLRRTFRHADHIFAVSEFTRQQLNDLGIDGIQVSGNGIDISRFQQGSIDEFDENFDIELENSNYILTVARLKEHKGHKSVIKALAQLEEIDTHYIIAGSGDGQYKKELEVLIKEEKLQDKIHFLGFVPDKYLSVLYEQADVYVMPSIAGPKGVEGFGISYLEAGALGTPVIGSTSGGASSIIEDGVNGFLINPGDHEALASRINMLLSDPETREKMGKLHQEIVMENYTWKKIVCEMRREFDYSDGKTIEQ